MKMIEAIIQPFKLEDVKESLRQVGVRGLTVSEVQGFGRGKGRTVQFRGSSSTPPFVSKLKLQIVVTDAQVPQVEQAIHRAARTGNAGDGKIFVYSLEGVARIRTGERGDDAV